MYVLLNQDQLKLHYKHPVPEVLCNLAWIELGPLAYTIGPCDHTTLRGLTDMELKVLYRNTTGKEMPTDNRNATLQILCDIMEAMPVSEVFPCEVELQAACISEDLRGFFKYVAGSKKPACVQELYSAVFKTDIMPDLEAKALAGDYRSLKTKQSSAVQRVVKDKPVTPVKTKEPGEGTTSYKIWKLADQFWGAVNQSTIKGDIDNLKRQIVENLLKEGVNRSTITTQLSHWQRNRISS